MGPMVCQSMEGIFRQFSWHGMESMEFRGMLKSMEFHGFHGKFHGYTPMHPLKLRLSPHDAQKGVTYGGEYQHLGVITPIFHPYPQFHVIPCSMEWMAGTEWNAESGVRGIFTESARRGTNLYSRHFY